MREDCFADRGNGWSPHYQNNRTASLIYWSREGVAVGFLLLYCQQLSICNTEGLLSLLRGNKSPHPPLSIFPTSSSWFYFENALWRPLVFLFLFRQIHPLGRFFFFPDEIAPFFPQSLQSFCADNLPGDVLKWPEMWFPRQPKAGCYVTHFSTQVSLWGVCILKAKWWGKKTPHWYTVWQWKANRKRMGFRGRK